ncbi:unnamed protein product [Calypogeia fissa]
MMILIPTKGSLWPSKKMLNSPIYQSSDSSQAGGEKAFHSMQRGWIPPTPMKKVRTRETMVEGYKTYNHSSVTASVSTEKDAPVKREFLRVEGICFRPPGTEFNLLDKVSMSLPAKSLGLVYGPSGSGKTTLLQVLGGLVTPTEGSIYLGKDGTDVIKSPSGPLSLSSRVGIVFQFPERYFLTDTIVEELLFGYSRQTPDFQLRHALTLRLQTAIVAVGLSGMPLDMNPRALSDGYKRRLALAVQLVRMPDVLLLDEPLAGLDWRARADVVRLLAAFKREKTVIVVSHDLKELAGLVDKSWRMEMGGKLTEQPLEGLFAT